MKLIDLRSDTLSRPSAKMLQAMYHASSGDASYDEDVLTNQLEAYCAKLFAKEAAILTCSGTMSNQIAIRAHTNPGDVIVLDAHYHVNTFEADATHHLAGVKMQFMHTPGGIATVENLHSLLHNNSRGCAPKLVVVENTINDLGGKIYPFEELHALFRGAQNRDIAVHLDGARILNASVATNISPSAYTACADSVSLCFTKGLGAPFGSILAGSASFIQRAKQYRRWYGGGLRQTGYFAAAALYALKYHVKRLADDHANAKCLAEILMQDSRLAVTQETVDTNIVMMKVDKLSVSAEEFVQRAKQKGVLLYCWNKDTVRAVTYLDIATEAVITAGNIILKLCAKL